MPVITYAINPRGRRVEVPLSDIEFYTKQGWIHKPDAKESYYPNLDKGTNKEVQQVDMEPGDPNTLVVIEV